MTLVEFNREEWADQPYLIELRGGFYDGKRHHWHDLPLTWRQARASAALLDHGARG